MRNPFKKFEKGYLNDAYFGFRDASVGYYDKYYRYSRNDEGRKYDKGVMEALKQGAVIEHFIENN